MNSTKHKLGQVNIRLIIGIVIALVIIYLLTLGRSLFSASADTPGVVTPLKNADTSKIALYKDIFSVSIGNNVDEIDANQPLVFHVEAGAKPIDAVSTNAQDLAKALQVATADDFGKFKVKMAKDIFGQTYKPNDIRVESVTRVLGGTGDVVVAQLLGSAIGSTDTAAPVQFVADYPFRTPSKIGKGTIKSSTFIRLVITQGAATIRDVRLTEATDTDTWIDPDINITTKPIITSVLPEQAKVGEKITLTGTSFMQTASNSIKFLKDGQVVATVANQAATIQDKSTPNVRTLKVAIPTLEVGTYNLVVTTRNGDSTNPSRVEVIVEKATITGFTIGGKSVTEGTIGDTMTINGLKFGARNDVYFDDRKVASNVPSTNETSIPVTIPDLAAKAYKVTVRIGNQVSDPVNFTVKARSTDVTITSFANTDGSDITTIAAGQDLVIHGTNFGTSNAVLFNGKVVAAGLVSTEEGTTIQLRVPKSQKAGSYSVKIKAGDKESDAKSITVTKAK